MNNMIKKLVLAALAAALVFSAFPATSVFAQGENPPKGELTNEKLEQIWARQLKHYEHFGKAFADIDGQVAKIQDRINKIAESGKDVTALQAALDAFEAAALKAKPTYESIKGIVNSHQGFDANGKVTDAEKAKSTLRELGEKLKELKTLMGGTGKVLREAMKAFRTANKPSDGLDHTK